MAIKDRITRTSLHTEVTARMRSLRYSGNSTPENWQGALQDYELIAQALAQRDMKKIKKAVNDHFANTIQIVANSINPSS